MGPAAEKLRILVVATREVASEVRGLLLEAGFAEPTLGDGGDETYSSYERVGPHIVLLGAHLERGDARSLAAAMKAGDHAHFVRVILLGEENGPIRNALDAADFEVDRFLGRPLAAKALSFAVHSCGAAALKAQADGPTELAKPSPRKTPPPPPVRPKASTPPPPPPRRPPKSLAPLFSPAPAPLVSELPQREPTLIVSPHAPLDAPPLVALEADSALSIIGTDTSPKAIADAIDRAIDEVEGDDELDADAMTNPRIGFAATELGLPPDEPVGDAVRHSHLIDEAMEAAIAEFVSDAISSVRVGLDDDGLPVQPSDGVPVASPTEETQQREIPVSGMREPTLILSPGASLASSPPPLDKPLDRDKPASNDDYSDYSDVTSQSTEVPESAKRDEWRADASRVGDALAEDAGLFPRPPTEDDDELLGSIDADERLARLDDLDDLSDLEDDLADLDALGDTSGPSKPRRPSSGKVGEASGGGDEQDDERTRKRPVPVRDANPIAVSGPGSGAVARELRRKMSAMAERLFPGQVSDSGVADPFSLPHDANTEIDFSSLESGQTGVLGPVPYRGIGRVETFADTNPLIEAPPTKSDKGESRFSGSLGGEHEDVATLLARLHLSNFSGAVKLTKASIKSDSSSEETEAVKTIDYDDGRPVFASSNLARDRMGDLLYREGKISRDQHVQCNELLEGSGRRMGELLVEMGFLKPRELLPAVRRHIEDIFYSVFSWASGRYEVLERESPKERIRLSRHPAALVIEGVRRKYDLARLEERLGSNDAIIAPCDEKSIDSIATLADLAPSEEDALQLFDGVRGIAAITKASELDLLAVSGLAFASVALGAAEIVLRTSEEDAATDSGRSSALVGETDIAIDRQRVLAKLALVEDADYFMLLGVRRDASRFEIRRAYEAARRDYASDAFPERVRAELQGEIEMIGELIDEAFQILGNDSMRRAYLENLVGA